MSSIYHKFYTTLLLILFLGFPSESVWSQYTMSGASSVNEGSSHTYTLSPTNTISSTTWSFFKHSSVIASYTSQNTTNATVNFVDGGTTGTAGVVVNIFDTGSNFHFASKSVTINTPPPPSNPGNPTVSNNNCGNATLTRSGSPPSGVTWYWQGTNSSGTSTSLGSGSTYTAGTSGTYYIRARDNSTYQWSTGSGSVTVSVANFSPGSINGTQTICLNGDPGILGNSSSPSGGSGGYTYHWQMKEGSSGSWAIIPGYPYSTLDPPVGLVTMDTWFRRGVTSCGTTKYTSSVKVTVLTTQTAQPTAPSITSNCGNTVLTRGTPPSGDTWYWQSSATGTSTSNSNVSITLNSGTVHYLRAISSSGCWSDALAINYTIDQGPSWYADTDGDGLGDPAVTMQSCTQPQGYVDNDQDQCPTVYTTNNNCQSSDPQDHNYVYTRTYQEPSTTTIDPQRFVQNDILIQEITFFDGLGRQEQRVSIAQAPDEKDLIQHIDYDSYGRPEKEWLPFAKMPSSHGNFQPSSYTETNDFYVLHYSDDILTSAPNPYSQKLFEESPLSRVLKQSAPGEAWALNATGEDHSIEFAYMGNEATEVRHYYVTHSLANNTYTPTLQIDASPDDFYPEATLYKNVTYDENHNGSTSKLHTTEEYTDQRGQVVLKRTYALVGSTETPHDTYYVYDDYGNLTYVLPPKVDTSNGVSATELDELCYQYVYDQRNRLVEKKLPGKGWEYIVYNTLDQPVMTQDGVQRPDKEWLFTKYDAFGRIAYTGLHVHPSIISRETMQGYADNTSSYDQFETQLGSPTTLAGTTIYYSNNAIPSGMAAIYTVNYYGSYVDTDGLSVPSSVLGQTTTSDNSGLPTVTKVRILGTTDWITTISGYDEKSRPIYNASKNNYLNTTDVMETELDFMGKPTETKSTHTKDSNTPIVTIDTFVYDHVGRLERHTQTVGGESRILVENTYDVLGQLVGKDIAGGLQNVDFEYNVRGWLTQINDPNNLGSDLFGFAISYNSLQAKNSGGTSYGTPLYNGNIAEVFWHTANDASSLDNRGYFFEYDALNRLAKGDYIWKYASNSYHSTDNAGGVAALNEELSYDKNGNITNLKRGGSSQSYGYVDDLAYSYFDSGNRLKRVTDSGTDNDPNADDFKDGTNTGDDYGYDDNGNMTSDLNKNITSISYNHLNLPTNIVTSSGNISYVYDAAGTKLKKTVSGGGSVTDYAGNYVYQDGALQFFSHPEGYVTPDGSGGYDYVYQYKDHLGNVRLSYADTSVRVDDDYDQGTDGWSNPSSGSISNSGQRLNISLVNKWSSTSKYLDIVPGEPISIEFDFVNGDMVKPTFYVRERINGVWEPTADRDRIVDVSDGNHVMNLTLTGDHIRLYFEKSTASDDGTLTTCYVDNFKVYQQGMEIVEESNYYPFGLKHKGYNQGTSPLGNDVAQKWKYNGVELDETTGLYEMVMRQYDPTIARWIGIDPVTHHSMSTYTGFDNNPVFWSDPSGADGDKFSFGPKSDAERAKANRSVFNRTWSSSAGGGNGECCPNEYGGPGVVTGDGEEYVNALDGVTVSPSSQQQVSVLGLANYVGDLKNRFNEGVITRTVETADFLANDIGSSEYWGPTLYNAGIDFVNLNIMASNSGSNFISYSIFSAGISLSNMSANDFAFGLGYNSPELLMLGMAGAGNLGTIRRFSVVPPSNPMMEVSASYMFRHNQMRLVLRGANGQFRSGTGSVLTERQYFQLNGLDGLGRATRTTPLIESRLSKIPGWARWMAGGGLSGAVLYDRITN